MSLTRTLTALSIAQLAHAQHSINATSFTSCIPNNQITASSSSHVSIFEANQTLSLSLNGTSAYSGQIILAVEVLDLASSQPVYQSLVDPCTVGIADLCPIAAGNISLATNFALPSDVLPAGAYTTADLELEFRLYVNGSMGAGAATGERVGCLQARLSNGVVASNNGTVTGNVTQPGQTNGTAPAGSSGGDGGGSGASASCLSWTVLL